MSELQRLTERVGEALSRSVAIDDPNMRLLSYSPHYGAVDEQRLASILRRQATPEAIAWARSHGVHKADQPCRLPSDPETGIMGRLCVPIKYQERLIGYLWIIDSDQSLNANEVAIAETAAAEAALILFRNSLLSDLERARERELLRDLIDPDESVRDHSLVRITEESLVELGRPAAVIVLDTLGAPSIRGRADAAELAVSEVRRALPHRRSLGLMRPDHAILLVIPERSTTPAELAHQLLAAFESGQATADASASRVGLGTTVTALGQAHESYQQARQAVRIGRVLGLSSVVEWAELGIYRLLARLEGDAIDAEPLHPALHRLQEADASGQLLFTLETFLDLAGDVKATAERLFIHRATLYHRLAKIESIGDVNMRRGLDRLDLHLGLKLGHLSGRLPSLALYDASSHPPE